MIGLMQFQLLTISIRAYIETLNSMFSSAQSIMHKLFKMPAIILVVNFKGNHVSMIVYIALSAP
jgi:hypothetical protein